MAGATSEGSETTGSREVAGKAASFGAKLTDAVENVGTNIFGNNAFGRFINDINPVNIGISDVMKSADKSLNKKEKND